MESKGTTKRDENGNRMFCNLHERFTDHTTATCPDKERIEAEFKAREDRRCR